MFLPQILRQEKNAITVVLNNNDEGWEKDFRCVVCGKICFQYRSSVEVIVPGYAELMRPPLIIQCSRSIPVTKPNGVTVETKCKTKYYVVG